MASALDSLIGYSTHEVFRRAYIKARDETTGLYDSTWTEITEFVKSWGTFKTAVDDVRLNRFTHSGLTLNCRNDTGAFNPETDQNSLWNGKLTRYRTLVKIEGGYKDEDSTELPTDTTQGIYIINDEIPRSSKGNDAVLQCKSLVSVFSEVIAAEVAGLGSTQTASDLITKIRDHTDGAGSFVFRQFITSASWTIQTTTQNYNLATTTSDLQNMTVWDLMTKIAECEGFVVLINRFGGFEFVDRTENTTSAQFAFRGQGSANPNIISFEESTESLDKYFNLFRMKWLEPDTSTSFIEAGGTTVVDPSNAAWKFGTRKYDFENKFFVTTATAQGVVNSLLIEFQDVKEEVSLLTKFMPHVDVLDHVTLSYQSYDLAGITLWDQFNWASASATAPDDGGNWALEQGENFDYDDISFKVLSKTTNLNNMTSKFILRRI